MHTGDGIPRYARIQKILEERLIKGVYPVGSLIPTEIELAAEFSNRRTPTDLERRSFSDRAQCQNML